ncbi:hypothetical protein [Nocardia iowensis]|uniref:N-acetyltransferase domain-containing protein n=1 Tax=Nocardia iowensis TaxID=204891 RepID=A0ABX8RZS5_NOCIO|nr:hypothetical protein [Nocardia iowensis]QXN94766.1 hypothetical protein KV110_17980 [Nocardia iowensis]
MHLTATQHLVVATLIVAPESRERSIGSTVVLQILACADQRGVAVAATPSRDYGANLSRLRRFSRRHGFAVASAALRASALPSRRQQSPPGVSPAQRFCVAGDS